MFAGEGGPERTNRRFHYVSMGLPAKRLSTAFDSVTLYGEDPDLRPDIYGKIGNAGVSIACLDDAKKLYSGFNLANPSTSVSMTINGPAAHLAAFFMNAAIDQQCELYIKENGLEAEVDAKIDQIYAEKNLTRPRYQGELPDGNDGLGLLLLGVTGDQVLPADVYATIKARTLTQVRGTVQADILKEDQAQNTCIFSTEFALRLMGDVQEYFIQQKVRNFYSVSISGYHIAEAGANPITQLALTLSNGFTFVEYYVSRGMSVNDFAPNLSFFFSNGIDPEYAVIGRVARRIWAKAMKLKYGADARSQMLKYHIQTSGRSLHAQEIDFNDIRTTLQALYAIYDNCNSLHTNAYDEAITTPTEESVRRAMAIQLIINRELGWPKTKPAARLLHHRGAHRPGGRGGAARIRPHHGARRRARGHGNHVPARQNPGGKHALRDAEAHRRVPHHRREYLPLVEGLAHGGAGRSHPRHGRGKAVPNRHAHPAAPAQRRPGPGAAQAAAASGRGQRQPLRRADGNGEILLARADYERAV
jgi:methylmalonyl-CoA mutase